MNVTLYLLGTPGTGKYAIAQALREHGYIVCDNHLICNPILSLMSLDGKSEIPEEAWGSINMVRKVVLGFLSSRNGMYVLTNNLFEAYGDHKIYDAVKRMAAKRNSLFVPVELSVSLEENIRRIEQPERALRHKATSREVLRDLPPRLAISHKNLLTLDITTLSPAEVVTLLLEHIENITARNRS